MIIPSITLTIRHELWEGADAGVKCYTVWESGDAHARNGVWEKSHIQKFKTLPGVIRYLAYLVQQPAYKNANLQINITAQT